MRDFLLSRKEWRASEPWIVFVAEGESHDQTRNQTGGGRVSSEERKRVYRRKMRRVKRWAEDVHRSIYYRGQGAQEGSVRRV